MTTLGMTKPRSSSGDRFEVAIVMLGVSISIFGIALIFITSDWGGRIAGAVGIACVIGWGAFKNRKRKAETDAFIQSLADDHPGSTFDEAQQLLRKRKRR